MSHQITLSIPDEVYQPLLRKAQESGQSVESLVSEWISSAFSSKPGYGRLRKWAGAFDFGVQDVGLRHDEYLGDALLDKLRGSPNA